MGLDHLPLQAEDGDPARHGVVGIDASGATASDACSCSRRAIPTTRGRSRSTRFGEVAGRFGFGHLAHGTNFRFLGMAESAESRAALPFGYLARFVLVIQRENSKWKRKPYTPSLAS
jgi:hypothetical protein